MSKSFLNHEKPVLCAMLQYDNVEKTVGAIRNGLAEGAEAFGLQWESIPAELQTIDNFKKIISEMKDKPAYITNYRHSHNKGKTDEQLAEEMITLAENGGKLCDVMGDMFLRTEGELTMDPDAIQKQMEYIDKLHSKGAEVLMSSHVLKFASAEEVLKIAFEHKRRGADICKIVTGAETMEQQIENLRITNLLKNELGIPFLFLSGGECSIHRRLGMKLGCSLCLCVYEHYWGSTSTQPLLRTVKTIRDNIDF